MTRRMQEYTCRELADLLAGYFAGELDAEERATFEGHLATCRDCVAYPELCDDDAVRPGDLRRQSRARRHARALVRAILAVHLRRLVRLRRGETRAP